MRVKEKFTKKLLVEGNDDQHVIWALCEKFQVKETFDIIDCEGISNLMQQIPVRFKQSGLQALGIIVDADSEIKRRWDSIKTVLISQGFTVPDSLPLTGLRLRNSDDIIVGVWIMPNNRIDGLLEDFISFLVPEDDNLLPVVSSTLTNIEERNLNRYGLIHRSKAVVHSWLSWQQDPGTPMGLAITKRYLTTQEGTCTLLITWLNDLFNNELLN